MTEADALGVFGLVSRSALEGLAGAILRGDVASILQSIEMFESAGKNMRRLSGELLQHFRNLVVLQALGPSSPSLAATPDQIRALSEQAKGVDPNRVFRVCDQLVEMEDKLRYVLSARTLIEMSLIRASRIAATATIEELMRVVRDMKSGRKVAAPPAPAPATPVPKVSPEPPAVSIAELSAPASARSPEPAPAPKVAAVPKPAPASAAPEPPIPPPADAADILNDPKFNDILGSFPGATVVNIR